MYYFVGVRCAQRKRGTIVGFSTPKLIRKKNWISFHKYIVGRYILGSTDNVNFSDLDKFFISLHSYLSGVSLFGSLLRVGSSCTSQKLFLLCTHFLNQVISDVLQNGVLSRELQEIRKKSENLKNDQ